MNFIADLLAKLGLNAANTSTQGCFLLFIDEPKAPKCLIEK